MLLFIPSYQSTLLPSKDGYLSDIYNVTRHQATKLCQSNGKIAVDDYGTNIISYLCQPYYTKDVGGEGLNINIGYLTTNERSTPEKFVYAIETAGARSLIIEPYMFHKYPGLKGCPELRDTLFRKGWTQLAYSILNDGQCIAAYIK